MCLGRQPDPGDRRPKGNDGKVSVFARLAIVDKYHAMRLQEPHLARVQGVQALASRSAVDPVALDQAHEDDL